MLALRDTIDADNRSGTSYNSSRRQQYKSWISICLVPTVCSAWATAMKPIEAKIAVRAIAGMISRRVHHTRVDHQRLRRRAVSCAPRRLFNDPQLHSRCRQNEARSDQSLPPFDQRCNTFRRKSHTGKKRRIRKSRKSLKENGAPERIRTSDPQIRSLVLYPAELRARFREGREPMHHDP